MRRSPPYLKRHARRMQEHPDHPVFVFIGPEAWDRVKNTFIGCVCPLGDDPERFDWSALRNRNLVIVIEAGDIPRGEGMALIVALLRTGIRQISYASHDAYGSDPHAGLCDVFEGVRA